jgi:hypothetical protein
MVKEILVFFYQWGGLVSKFDLMRLRGGYYAIGEYTRFMFTRPKEATATRLHVSDTVQATPDQGFVGYPQKIIIFMR